MCSPARCSSPCTSQSDCGLAETIGVCHLCGLVLNPLSPLALKSQTIKNPIKFNLSRQSSHFFLMQYHKCLGFFHPRGLGKERGKKTPQKAPDYQHRLTRVCKQLQHILLVLSSPAHCWGGKEGRRKKIRTHFCCYEPLPLTLTSTSVPHLPSGKGTSPV